MRADPLIDGFAQVSPVAGAVPTRRTELRVWHDARTLFVAIRAFDPEPDEIVARQMRRDVEGMLFEDQVTLVIDAEGAGRTGYLFAINANGAQFDALIYDGGQMRYDWDALWHSEAGIDAQGWHARLEIPLAVFGQSGAGIWRINAERWMPRGSERVRLAGALPDRYVYSLGPGLAIPAARPERQDWGLRLKPSLRLTSESSAASGTGRSETRAEPGLELFHESASGLRTAAALNIDFGEAEADERAVNLTRFELFRLEKREFFLRDAGRFSFGGLIGGAAVIPYYSRRIGLDAHGRARSLDAGLKLTGSMGGIDFGAFAARVAGGAVSPGEPEQAAADVGVLRFAHPLGTRQRIGLIATRGNPQGTGGSSLWGLDYQFRDVAWAGNKTLEAHAWAMQSRNPDAAGGSVAGRAWGGTLSYQNIGPMAEVQIQRLGAGFDPALGYLAEANVRRSEGTAGWWFRTAYGADLIPALDWTYRETLDGSERTLELNPEITYTTPAGDTLMAEAYFVQDRLASAYAPVPRTTIDPGSYRWSYLYGLLETAQSRPVWVSGELRAGGYYDGRRNDQFATLGWKPAARWEARVGVGRNAIALPSGRFTVKLATLRLDYTPNTRLAQSVLLQWDNVSNSLGISARMRWRWALGSELMFALDRIGYTGTLRGTSPQQTRAMLKMVWNF
ncbi:MAG: hypothetical protein QM766_18265 [Burkholderiaceae bacterium]